MRLTSYLWNRSLCGEIWRGYRVWEMNSVVVSVEDCGEVNRAWEEYALDCGSYRVGATTHRRLENDLDLCIALHYGNDVLETGWERSCRSHLVGFVRDLCRDPGLYPGLGL